MNPIWAEEGASVRKFSFRRDKNKLADRLAHRARKLWFKTVWVSSPPFLNSPARKEPIMKVCKSLLS
ncbi:hypothetical protein C5167_046409 [Papaver somniferum]|uniref:Uncharacterized protein n=1 Tax=Papaver somniferum TaxID=3469 RepID=A0A4Y7LHJ6_PAPSO|nr:hypothetical protein C5167_046409 [Papaver somniferum]